MRSTTNSSADGTIRVGVRFWDTRPIGLSGQRWTIHEMMSPKIACAPSLFFAFLFCVFVVVVVVVVVVCYVVLNSTGISRACLSQDANMRFMY